MWENKVFYFDMIENDFMVLQKKNQQIIAFLDNEKIKPENCQINTMTQRGSVIISVFYYKQGVGDATTKSMSSKNKNRIP